MILHIDIDRYMIKGVYGKAGKKLTSEVIQGEQRISTYIMYTNIS